MNAVRRVYLYLAAGAALSASVACLIALLRNLLAPERGLSLEAAATQIGTLLVAVPIYLVHWRWAQGAAADGEGGAERASVVRQLYLYAVMAAALGSTVAIAFDLLSGLLTLALGVRLEDYRFGSGGPPPGLRWAGAARPGARVGLSPARSLA